ncbi:MAG: DUF3575 domain-containing protein [Flavobacteriales bacterium]|nr:DUF3575 domain-containing protein [Flavobacteriales bacterium]
MKKLIVAALILSGASLKAQHDVSLDVVSFAFSKYGLGYEYALNSQNSVGINFNMSSKNAFDDMKVPLYGEYKYSEMNIIPEYKWFATPNKGNDGVYMGFYGKFRTSSSKDNVYAGMQDTIPVLGKTDVSTSGISIGVLTGYKWKTAGAFFMEVTFGVGKFISNSVTVSDEANIDKLTTTDFDQDNYIPYVGNDMAVDLRIAGKIGFRFGGGSKE